ncbi:hypothetical protein ACH5RR_037090 [Cinchona calisaya]|uniref:Uncharacterized protein n=1 Tax=Cinchona calisaya TaxID=153742 RepID=A0ABD2Y542_9GENT
MHCLLSMGQILAPLYAIYRKNFDIKPGLLQTMQQLAMSSGSSHKDPNLHLPNSKEICNIFKKRRECRCVQTENVPFFSKGQSQGMAVRIPTGAFITWDGLAQSFITKYFLLSKTEKLRNNITSFG